MPSGKLGSMAYEDKNNIFYYESRLKEAHFNAYI